MAAEALVPEAIGASANIVLGGLLLVSAVVLTVAAWLAHMPGAMVAGAVAVVLLSAATLVSALARLELGIIPNPTLVLIVLRFSALILLVGAGWTLTARVRRHET